MTLQMFLFTSLAKVLIQEKNENNIVAKVTVRKKSKEIILWISQNQTGKKLFYPLCLLFTRNGFSFACGTTSSDLKNQTNIEFRHKSCELNENSFDTTLQLYVWKSEEEKVIIVLTRWRWFTRQRGIVWNMWGIKNQALDKQTDT